MFYSCDDSGWGHLVGPCVIAVASEDAPNILYIGDIQIEYFQDQLFWEKKYLERAWEIVQEAVETLRIGTGDTIYCCSGYVVSYAVAQLKRNGFKVIVESHVERRAHEVAENAFLERLKNIGAPVEKLLLENSDRNRARNFYTLLNWVKEDEAARMKWAKHGWTYFHPERKRAKFLGNSSFKG